MPTCAADRHASGFTLVEVLVAFVVAAVTLTAIFAAVSMAGERQRTGEAQLAAVAIARTRMELFKRGSFEPREATGREAGLVWHEAEKAAMRDPRGLWVLARLTIDVRDRRNRLLLRSELRKLKTMAEQ